LEEADSGVHWSLTWTMRDLLNGGARFEPITSTVGKR